MRSVTCLLVLLDTTLQHMSSLLHTYMSNLSMNILCIQHPLIALFTSYRTASGRSSLRRAGADHPGAGRGAHGAATTRGEAVRGGAAGV